MGYRSEVAIFIAFKTQDEAKEFMDRACKQINPAMVEHVRSEFKLDGRCWSYRDDSIKWYSNRLTHSIVGFPTVTAMEQVFDFAKTYTSEYNVDCMGGFARIGEEVSDVEEEHFYFDDEEGEPTPWDVVGITVTLDFDTSPFALAPIESKDGRDATGS